MGLEVASSVGLHTQSSRVVGRYLMYDEIASGGMASVHLGRLRGAVGFSRTVAIKYLHPHYSQDTEFLSMFLDEVRLAARIQHPNVAAPLDVVLLEDSKEIFLVMEYIHGADLSRLIASARTAKLTIPLAVSASIMNGALLGLHAAHEAVDECGQPLNIVHRDMSPQNIMVGMDGVARVLDFGVAKAVSRNQSTRQGHLKGKLSYMAPEQMRSVPIDRRVDVFTAGIVLWEALTHRRLFKPDDPASAISMIISKPIERPSLINPDVPPSLDGVVMQALDRNVDKRFQTAREFADALEEAMPLASHRKVGGWVERLCGHQLSQRAHRVSEIERSTYDLDSAKDLQQVLTPGAATLPRPAGPPLTHTELSMSMHFEAPFAPTADPPAPRRSWVRKAWPLLVSAPAFALLVGWGIVHTSHRTDTVAPGGVKSHAASPSRPTAQALTEPATPPLPSVKVEAEGPPSPDHAALPAAGDAVSTSPSEPNGAAGVPAQQGTAKAASTKPAKSRRRVARKDCDPPYSLDSQGIRRVKQHCL
jgi:serine/threonine-protein kinase